jgi:hypothetical protein
VVAGFGLWAAARRVAVLRGPAAALVVITVTAMGAPAAAAFAGRTVGAAVEDRFRAVDRQQTSMAPGTRRAARWLRDHSATGDLVATNAHCRRHNGCDNLRFWFSAFAERRFLVEGWGFTSRSNGMTGARSPVFAPYWDSGRLAANDAVFRTPDAANVDRLRRGYGVRWLLVDETATRVSADLGRHATLRFRAGRCAVYEL